MAARFMAFMLDSAFKEQVKSNVSTYSPVLPSIMLDQQIRNDIKIDIDHEANKAVFYYLDKKIGECSFANGVRRFGHIQFWDVKIEPGSHLQAMELCLRNLAVEMSAQFKKIEIFTANEEVAQLSKTLGFHCRGKKTGSCKVGNDYFDELGLDISFFNIKDAKELLNLSVDEYTKLRVASLLTKCQVDIGLALADNKIDQYTALYLENLAFQMTREGLGEQAIRRYGQKGQEVSPWNALIQSLPNELKDNFINLDKLTTKVYVSDSTPEYTIKREI